MGVRLTNDTLSRLLLESANNDSPVWSPDGARVAVRVSPPAPASSALVWQTADGSGTREELTPGGAVPQHFSPDGQFVAFQRANPKTLRDIWVVSLKDRKVTAVVQSAKTDVAPRFSPMDDGWRTCRMSRGVRKFTCSPFPDRAASGRYRSTAVRNQCGTRTAGSCSTGWAASSSRYRSACSQHFLRASRSHYSKPTMPRANFRDESGKRSN